MSSLALLQCSLATCFRCFHDDDDDDDGDGDAGGSVIMPASARRHLSFSIKVSGNNKAVHLI